jgi:hypothetical protein
VSDQNPSAAPAPDASVSDASVSEAPVVPQQSTGAADQSTETPAPAPVEVSNPGPPETAEPTDLQADSFAPKHAAAEGAEAPAAKPRRGLSTLIFAVVVVVIALVLTGGYWLFFLKDNPSRANVGDCLSGTENPSDVGNIKLVSCGDSSATYKITQKIGNQAKTANDTACAGTDHDDVYWYGRNDNNGTVLCLLKLKN